MKYTDKENTFVLLYILSQNRKKGAGKIQAKYNFKNFPSKLLIFRWVKPFLANGSLFNNQIMLTTPKNEKKDS